MLNRLLFLLMDDLCKFPKIGRIHLQFLKNFMIFRVFEGNAWVYHLLEFIFLPLVLLELINFLMQLLTQFSLNLLLELFPHGSIISELSNPWIWLQLPITLPDDLSYAIQKHLFFFKALRLHISEHLLFAKRIHQFSFLIHKYLIMNKPL